MDLGKLARTLRRPWMLVAVLVVNLAGIGYGFFYYGPQFRATPWWLWPLLPDSPFAVLLLSVALVLVLLGRSNPWWNLVGSAAMVKVGVWTAIVLVWFADHFQFTFVPDVLDCSGTGFNFRCADLNTYLFYLHLAMALEALLVIDALPGGWRPYAIVGGAYVLLDVVDYAWPADHLARGCNGIFPWTVPCDHLLATFAMTAGLTVVTLAGLWWLQRNAAKDTSTDHAA